MIPIASLIAGYVASVYTWPWLKVQINGVEAEYQKAKELVIKLRAKI